jgi:hypothetical protein
MNTPPQIPPPLPRHQSIRYQLTRGDVFANWMTIIFRNRMLQIFVLVALIINGCIWAPGFGARSTGFLVIEAGLYLVGFLGFLALVQAVMGAAHAFLAPLRGVVGEHTLEITDRGLIERTDCNETLHRWPMGRILSLGPYLYIYVSDTNSHQVPKRYFSPQEISAFEAALRTHSAKPGA